MRVHSFLVMSFLAATFLSNTVHAQNSSTEQNQCEKWATQSRDLFPIVCSDHMSENVIIQGAKDSSHNQLILVVWGGSDSLRLEGLKVIHSMHKQGKSVAIAFGPDRDGSYLSAEFELFAHGGRALEYVENIGSNNIGQIPSILGPRINEAYEANFSTGASSGRMCPQDTDRSVPDYPIVQGGDAPERVVQKVSEDLSHENLILTQWGGNTALKAKGRMVSDRMRCDGLNVKLVYGPDRDGSDFSAEFEFFAHGKSTVPENETPTEYGINHIQQIEKNVTLEGLRTYRANYP